MIVITYADYDEAELETYVPKIVHVDQLNRLISLAEAQLDAALPAP